MKSNISEIRERYDNYSTTFYVFMYIKNTYGLFAPSNLQPGVKVMLVFFLLHLQSSHTVYQAYRYLSLWLLSRIRSYLLLMCVRGHTD